MRILLYLGTVILLLLSACESNQQTANTEKSVNSEQETNTTNNSLTNRDEATQEIDDFLAALQGRWKRTTYPYGTVEYKGNEVKFVAGEGAAEPPQFQQFRLSDSCPYSTDKEQIATYPYFTVSEENRTCESIKLNKDFLSIAIKGTTPGSAAGEIVYARMPNGETSSATNKNQNDIIPKSIRGKWAIGKENCGVRNHNHQQITIDENSIQFFENRAELGEIMEYTPTWIVASFKRRRLEDSQPYSYSPTLLEAQKNGKVLIVQQYAKENYPEAIQYERCE
ncbi:hypothetical protein [Pleurocapsa sp. PCC 7319]|uniref:hypothetical protein n=1 Tax=Pleurocapsa sp. PCC 7319 TaxID=118161 RepID=UPI00034ABBE3|nr:hypothetical protein [Pleurocapsa sp. PCC 7319]